MEVMLMISPAIRPPSTAPGNEPTPPITTTTNVCTRICSPTSGASETTGALMMPAKPAAMAPMPNTTMNTRSTLMPSESTITASSMMVDSLGINVDRVFMIVFGIGAMAAGFAGIINAPIVSLAPEVGEQILVQTFVVVVIGGVGSFPGAVLGGLIAGEIISITSMINPGYAYVMLFAAMTLALVLRPYGLLGTQGRE